MATKHGTAVHPKYRDPTTANPHTYVRTRREGTTTTNVVSVVPSAARACAHARTHVREGTDLLESLRALSEKDRKQILDQLLLEKQLQTSTPSQREVAMWASAVHRELVKVGGTSDGGLVGMGLVQKAVAAGASWQHVQGFMQMSNLQGMTVIERQAAYYILAEMVVRHAKQAAAFAGAPLSLKVVVNCTNALPGLFDQSFPGYVTAGLAQVVVRQASRALQ